MFLALACPLILVKRHLSGYIFYEGGCVNFIKYLDSFLVVSTLTREAKNTAYFIIIKRGTNTDNILDSRLRRGHIYEFIVWPKAKNPLYAGIAISFEAFNWFPDNEICDHVFIYDDENIDGEPNVASTNDYYGNKVSSILMPLAQELERYAVQYQIN